MLENQWTCCRIYSPALKMGENNRKVGEVMEMLDNIVSSIEKDGEVIEMVEHC